jgi:hypothetical protein
LKVQAHGKKTTPQANELQERRNALHRRIENWRQVQTVYMPAVAGLLAAVSTTSSASHPESSPLYLPSDMPQENITPGSLADKERRLRIAQADDSLTELKRLLRITMGLWEYKNTQVGPSQHSSTRTRTMITRFKNKMTRCVNRYRAARLALLRLDPHGDWIMRLRELKPEDIRAPEKRDGEAEGTRELSWIWIQEHGETASERRGTVSEHEVTQDEINDGELLFLLKFLFIDATFLQGYA